MDKAQAIHKLWASFGLTAYDENSVPDDARLPYITYSVSTASLGDVIPLTASIWYRSTSWKEVTAKSEEIAKKIGENGFYIEKLDSGYVWVTKGVPFAQRFGSDADPVKRIYINVMAEFLTAY